MREGVSKVQRPRWTRSTAPEVGASDLVLRAVAAKAGRELLLGECGFYTGNVFSSISVHLVRVFSLHDSVTPCSCLGTIST